MNIRKKLTHKDTIPVQTPRIHQASLRALTKNDFSLGKKILTKNLGWQPHQHLVIVTDEHFIDQEAAVWFETAKQLGAENIELFILCEMTHSGEEPPDEVIEASEKASHVILHTYYSLTHTQAGKKALLRNGVGASLPGVSKSLMTKLLNQDYQPIYDLGEKLKKILENGTTIKITSQHGTTITANIRQEKIYNDSGLLKPGEVGNLPAGEVFFSPVLESTNGTFVVNGSIADDTLKKPIKIIIENGIATKIKGDIIAQNFQQKLATVGPRAFTVAEIGIGTNPAASPTATLIEAEKAYGTVHLALGNSSAIGGEVDVPIHLDGLTLQPSIWVDDMLVLENGEFRV